MDLAKTEEELLIGMRNCYQFEGMNMLQHGEAVREAFQALINQLEGGESIIELPPQIVELYEKTKHKLLDSETIRKYQIYHDCGKYICRTVDENGKQHFPNHAWHSANQYAMVFNDLLPAMLILHDMHFHTMKGDELIHLWTQPIAPTLYFTAWAEIIANSKMFGGFDSTSFKIKKKALISAAKKYHD